MLFSFKFAFFHRVCMGSKEISGLILEITLQIIQGNPVFWTEFPSASVLIPRIQSQCDWCRYIFLTIFLVAILSYCEAEAAILAQDVGTVLFGPRRAPLSSVGRRHMSQKSSFFQIQ